MPAGAVAKLLIFAAKGKTRDLEEAALARNGKGRLIAHNDVEGRVVGTAPGNLLRDAVAGEDDGHVVLAAAFQGQVHQGAAGFHGRPGVIEDPGEPDLLFAGTEFGLYFTRDGGRLFSVADLIKR